MLSRTLPFFLEDRTGVFSGSDFDDIYDRLFLKVSPPPPSHPHAAAPSAPFSLMIHNTGRRSSSHPSHARDYGGRASREQSKEPAIILEFGPRGALGNVIFTAKKESVPMGTWLRKTSLFGGSLSRKFRASDGEEYRWLYQGADGQEWTLVDSRDYLVAHYNIKPADKPAYNTSGNILTVYETHGHIAVEILASLTIMRHILAHNL